MCTYVCIHTYIYIRMFVCLFVCLFVSKLGYDLRLATLYQSIYSEHAYYLCYSYKGHKDLYKCPRNGERVNSLIFSQPIG